MWPSLKEILKFFETKDFFSFWYSYPFMGLKGLSNCENSAGK